MDRTTRVFVYEHVSADPLCADRALASQGRAMRNAMVADLAVLQDVQVSCAAGAAGDETLATRRVRPLRRAAGERPADFLRRQAQAHDLVWVVAPEYGGVLASLRAAVPDHQWLGCSRQAIDLAGSKRATARVLAAAGIASTRAQDPSSPPDSAAAHWVVKPDDGCGAQDARRHADFASACADYGGLQARHGNAVMEQWVEGEPLSVALLCGLGQVEILSVNRQRLSFDAAGAITFDGVCLGAITGERARTTAALARRACMAIPGLAGFVGIDVTWHPVAGPVVIEVNPRVTCAYEGLSAFLGRNVAQQMLALHRRAVAHA